MNLKSLNDEGLLHKTDALVQNERELLTSILHHLREIERRRLFSALGYKSLFDMAVRRFGYSEDQAYRRIAAMRLLKELPEVEEKISSGEITLTHIGLAHSLFNQEKKQNQTEMPREAKLSVIERFAGTPVREAERIALALSSKPEDAKPDRIQALSAHHIEMKFTASVELRRKVETLKGLLAHKNPDMSLGELFEKLCDLGLKEWDPGKTAAPRKRRVKPELLIAQRSESGPNQDSGQVTNQNSCQESNQDFNQNLNQPKSEEVAGKISRRERTRTKAPSAAITRAVWRRAGSRCENCGSSFALEIDHKVPRAKGGSNDIENLRLTCRSCNQRAAIEAFGQMTMDRYIH